MTVEEAIKILEVNAICSPKATDFKEAVETIKKALEKQIPKKPVGLVGDYDLPICPECKQMVDNTEFYCSTCGQELDWSDSE